MYARSHLLTMAVSATLLASLAACGGGGGSANSTTPPPSQTQSVMMPLSISDASAEDWALIGVGIRQISLTPQGGGTPVVIYSPATPTAINLVELDQLGEVLGNVSIPEGTYSAATITISANPGDITLTTSAQPEAGFAAGPSTTIPSSQIQIQKVQGTAPNLTTNVAVKFDSPLVATTTTQNNALDIEFDLSHPAFIVDHVPANGGATIWAVNFEGPVRRHRIDDITRFILRHTYGNVSSIGTGGSSIVIAKDVPAIPIQTPETAVATGQSLTINVDSTNGTLLYDVDAKTVTTIKSFSSETTLPGDYVRVAARYQENGTLVATRIWASKNFSSVWLSPEGHVLHVDAGTNTLVVENESGQPVPLTIATGTQFFFRAPESMLSESTPIGTGPAFLAGQAMTPNIVRGFKVHVSVVDPLAAQLVAQTVDIETAKFDGTISGTNATSFTYTRNFVHAADDYSALLGYISATSKNGTDASGNPIVGFKYWNFAYPTLPISGANAIADFTAATNGTVSFGGTFGAVDAIGVSYARWGDAANVTGWSVPWAVLEPTPLPRGLVASGLVNNGFTMSEANGTLTPTVTVSTTVGSATLVYQVDRTNNVVTVSPEDITTSAGLSALTNGVVVGAPVKVYSVPQADGTLKAYTVIYFTGSQMPST